MANVNDYTFFNTGRIGMDVDSLSESEKQYVKNADYMLSNHFASDCTMSKPMDVALSQPSMFYKGSNQVGVGGCNIDENSNLLLGSQLTHGSEKITLNERAFKTVPYLGKGRGDVDLESQLTQGESLINKKSMNPSSEVSYINYKNYPLIPSVAESLANPSAHIEDSADENWIRGGLPSRDLVRDNKNA
jgi:hypothetical protein|tara:strand:+ start:2050 stop:2616 length:567 start_codon:yes stop_codon:yes gene_type:complete